MTATRFRIVPLADAPDAVATLSDWFTAEWAPYYGPGGPGDAAADLAECLRGNSLPVAVVALGADGAVLGTAALKDESVGGDVVDGPWLAALVVDAPHRRCGVATALVAAIEDEAARRGFESLAISTDVLESMLTRRGWRPVGDAESLRGPVAVWRKHLAPGRG